MGIIFLPKTKLGKWAVWLIIAFFIIVAFVNLFVTFYLGIHGGETFFDAPAISIPIAIAWLCGIGAFVLGLMSILKNREHSVLVYIVTIIGLLLVVFFIIEIGFPH